MKCQKIEDERLQADKMDVLYGEADAGARARLQEHLAECPACHEEMQAFSRLRADLAAWQLPTRQTAPRGVVFVPRWLAVAAALLVGIGLSLGVAGVVSLQRALAAQEARTAALEASERQVRTALEQARASGVAASDIVPPALLARVDARVDERLRASEARQAQALDQRFAKWNTRLDAQRRVDLARVAEGLSYLDGRHGQQLARTNELMGYVLSAAAQKR